MEQNYDRVFGRNPVKEALLSGRNINKIYMINAKDDHNLNHIYKLAKERNIFVQQTDRRKLDTMTQSQNHQGVLAMCSPIEFVSLNDILSVAHERNEKPFIVVLDEITDPHNAGAIIRSAYCAGAHGIIIPKRRSAAISEGVYKASAGSIEYIKIAQVSNIAQTLDTLKKQGLFAVCLDMDGEKYYNIDFDMPVVVVVGSEGNGVGKLIKSKCDFVSAIPMKGKLDSLNASVAAGIVLFEISRGRS